MKKLLTFFVAAIIAYQCTAQINTTTRLIKFRAGVQSSSDTTETSGNEGNIWYDFVTGKFRYNQGGTNSTFGSGGGGGAFWPLAGTASLSGNLTINIDQVAGKGLEIKDVGGNTALVSLVGQMCLASGDYTNFALANSQVTVTNQYAGMYAQNDAGEGIVLNMNMAEANGANFQDIRTIKRGFEYYEDYSVGYTSRSLTDKAYVQGLTLEGSASLNFPAVLTNTVQTLTMTVTGAVDGDPVSLGVPAAAVINTLTYFAWVSSANTVSVRAVNVGGASSDPPAATFKVTVHKP